MTNRFLVTGGAGFIGSACVRHALAATEHHVLVLDKLTHAGNLETLAGGAASLNTMGCRWRCSEPSGQRSTTAFLEMKGLDCVPLPLIRENLPSSCCVNVLASPL